MIEEPNCQGSKYMLFVFILVSAYLYSLPINAATPALDSLFQIYTQKSNASLSISLHQLIRQLAEEDSEQAFTYARQLLTIETQRNAPIKNVFEGYILVGWTANQNLDYSTAIQFYTKALQYLDAEKDIGQYTQLQNNIGSVYWEIGQFDKALEYYFQGLKSGEENKDTSALADIITNIAAIYEQNTEYEKALEYANRGLNLAIATGGTPGSAFHYYRLASIYHMKGETETCIQLAKKALSIAAKHDYHFVIYTANMTLSRCFFDKNELNIALEFAKEASKAAHKINLIPAIFNSNYEMAKTYCYLNQFDQVKPLMQEMHHLKPKIKRTEWTARYHSLCAKVHTSMGNPKEALKYLEYYKNDLDTIQHQNFQKRISELDAQYELKTQNLIQKELENTVAHQARQRNLLLVISSLLFFLLGIGFYFYRKKNKLATEQEKLYQYAQRKAYQLKQANLDLEQFSAIISHDILSHLDSHLGIAKVANKENAFNLIQQSITTTQQLKQFCLDIISLYKPPQPNPTKESINLEELIETVKMNLRCERLQINCIIEHDQLAVIFGNRSQLLQLFQNLIENAVKYRRPDVELIVKIEASDDQNKNYKRFSITDNGIGIPIKDLDKVFDFFYQGQQRKNGSGLGLAICKKIVESNEGKIWAEANEQNGSTIFFTWKK